MRVFKATYKDRQGRKRESRNWYVEIKDHLERTRRLPACQDKAAAGEVGRKIKRLVALKIAGEGPDAELVRWIEGLPTRTREYLAKIKLLDSRRLTAAKPLVDHLADFKQSILDKPKSSEARADKALARIRRCVDDLGCKWWSDVDTAAVAQWLRELHEAGTSARTVNYYGQSLAQFGKWMVKDKRASEHPFADLPRFDAGADCRRERRALDLDEIRDLLAKTAQGPERANMPGAERALLYRLALESGLRANELRTLNRGNFDLNETAPTVTVEAGNAKNRRRAVLPLRADTAGALRDHLRDKLPSARAFSMRKHWRSAEMLARDLRAAGVEVTDDAGRVVDFHALRHTFVTLLARSRVHPNTAKALARHSTITLTMDRYSHVRREDELEAVDRLPSFDLPLATEATGTEGGSVLASCLASKGGNQGHGRTLDAQSRALENGRGRQASTNRKPASQNETESSGGPSACGEVGGPGETRTRNQGIMSPLL